MIGGDADGGNYKDKVAKVFNYRVHNLRTKQPGEDALWEKAVSIEKNYIMRKHGYKHMLDDIEAFKKDLSKFKRGLSIIEIEDLYK